MLCGCRTQSYSIALIGDIHYDKTEFHDTEVMKFKPHMDYIEGTKNKACQRSRLCFAPCIRRRGFCGVSQHRAEKASYFQIALKNFRCKDLAEIKTGLSIPETVKITAKGSCREHPPFLFRWWSNSFWQCLHKVMSKNSLVQNITGICEKFAK